MSLWANSIQPANFSLTAVGGIQRAGASNYQQQVYSDSVGKIINPSEIVDLNPTDVYQAITGINLSNFGATKDFPTMTDNGLDYGLVRFSKTNPYTSAETDMKFDSTFTNVVSFTNDQNVRFPIVAFYNNTYYVPSNYSHTEITDRFGNVTVKGLFEGNDKITFGYVPRNQTGKNLFKNCVNMRTAIVDGPFPKGTFDGCTSLEHIYVMNVVSFDPEQFPFAGCQGLYDISTFKLTTIGPKLFAAMGGSQPTHLIYPNVTSVDIEAFDSCSSVIEYLELPGVTSLPDGMFDSARQSYTYTYNSTTGNVDMSANPSTVTFTAIEDLLLKKLTDIPIGSFNSMSGSLKHLDIPSVKIVQQNAFNGYMGLNKVLLDTATALLDGVFVGCPHLEIVYAPKVTSLGTGVFTGCFALKELSLDSITTLGTNSFGSVINSATPYMLTKVSMKSLTSLKDISGVGTFQYCPFLTGVEMPELTSLDNNSFSTCASLADVYFPKLNAIGTNTFLNCTGAKSLELPALANLTTNPFSGMSGLISIILDGLKTIASTVVFSGLTSLQTFSAKIYNGAINNNMFSGDTALLGVTMYGVTTVGNNAFYNCSSVVTFGPTLFNKVTQIGTDSFYGCTKLNALSFPMLLTIPTNVPFTGCNALATLNLGKITSIGNWQFSSFTPALSSITADHITSIPASMLAGCVNLTSIKFNLATTIGANAFSGCTNLAIVELMGYVTNGTHFFQAGLFQNCPNITTIRFGDNFTTLQTGSGPNTYYNFSSFSNLTSVQMNGVTDIQSGTFQNCAAMRSISLPAVVTFGNNVFSGCTSLTSAILSVNAASAASCGNNLFAGCSSLEVVDMGKIATLGTGTFTGCTNLTVLRIPNATTLPNFVLPLDSLVTVSFDSLTVLPNQLFQGAPKLTNVSIPLVTDISAQSFQNCVALKTIDLTSVTNIGDSAFNGCSALTTVSGLDTTSGSRQIIIGDYTFQDCSNLSNISFVNISQVGQGSFQNTGITTATLSTITYVPEQLFQNCLALVSASCPLATVAGDNAFSGCPLLASVNLPKLLSIGLQAFYQCIALITATIGQVQSIGDSAFEGCSSLVTISGLQQVTTIGTSVFKNCSKLPSVTMVVNIVPDYCLQGCTSLTTVSLPNAVQLGLDVFDGCLALTFVSIPMVTALSDGVFNGCAVLNSVNINSVVTIGNNTFAGCASLTSISGPQVTTLGDETFYGCIKLNETTASFPLLTTIGNYTFSGCSALSQLQSPLVASAGENAFQNCVALANINMPLLVIDSNFTFSGCSQLKQITLSGQTITGNPVDEEVAQSTFVGCDQLVYLELTNAVTIPDVLLAERYNLQTFIANKLVVPSTSTMFSDCNQIYEIQMNAQLVMPDQFLEDKANLQKTSFASMTEIGQNALRGCKSIDSVNYSNVVKVGSGSFQGCSGVTDIILPSCIVVGVSAFQDCTSLQNLTLAAVPNASNNDPNKYILSSSACQGCTQLQQVQINAFTTLDRECFQGCTRLGSISFLNIVRVVDRAFKGCSGLQTVTLRGATTLTGQPFLNCTALQTVTMPLCTSIGQGTFVGCQRLTTVSLSATIVPTSSIFNQMVPGSLRFMIFCYTTQNAPSFVPATITTLTSGNTRFTIQPQSAQDVRNKQIVVQF